MSDALDLLARWVRDSEAVVYLAGAGLSVASGIRAYRTGPDAVWDAFVTEWGTVRKFLSDPAAWWSRFWLEAHAALLTPVAPNDGHRALARLVRRSPRDLLVTQNVDGLSRAAGHPEDQLVEIHGRADRFVCARKKGCLGITQPVAAVDLSAVDRGVHPRCVLCGAPLRPMVLLFDEYYDDHPAYQSQRTWQALGEADLVVFVGTSFSVGITDVALRATGPGRRAASINVEAPPSRRILDVRGPAEVMLPALAAELGLG